MTRPPSKAPATERLIFWSVAILLLVQVVGWVGLQVRESRRLLEARITSMRAGRAEAWQYDSMAFLVMNVPRDYSEGPGVVTGRLPDARSLAERRRAIEERYPYVAVLPEPVEPDDPVLLSDPPVYLTLRKEVLAAMAQERTQTLYRTTGEAVILVGIVLLGMTYIYRKLNAGTELMLRQRNFLAAVTHELKTPIASLRVWMETLTTRSLEADQKGRIQMLMDRDLTRLTELVGNLLQVARADSGNLEIHPEAVELAPWLRGVCETMDHRLGPGQLGLVLELGEGISARIDPKAMGTVIENLLSNAYKYAQDPRRTTVILSPRGETEVLITVADRGIGLAAKDLPKLFQRFFRVGDEMTRSVPGTGLGLFLCREIVQAHQGEIQVASQGTGLGSTFTIRLPRLAG